MQKNSFLARLTTDESGATAIEYGLIVALIVIAIIGAMSSFASTTNGMWSRVTARIIEVTSQI